MSPTRLILPVLLGLAASGIPAPVHAAQQEPAKPAPSAPGAQGNPRKPDPVGTRRAVKNGTDPDAAKVDSKPVRTSVEKLLEIPRPPELLSSEPDPELEEKRLAPTETTIWELEAEVVACQLMPDGDYRVVLKGESGRKLVVELPDPKLAGPKSRWAKEIAQVRKQFDERYHPGKTLTEVSGKIRLQGVGHWGRVSVRPTPENLGGVRLQPVVKIEWK